jgi:hypothetical protein
MLDNRMLVGLVSGVTPLAHLDNLSYHHLHVLLDGPAFSLSLSQTSSGNRFGDRNPALTHTNRRQLTEERLFSPVYYYTVGKSGYAVKCHNTSVVLWLDYLQSSLFISMEDNS